MKLMQLIRSSFPEGLSYDEAAQLCLRLYCSVDGIPELVQPECSKDGLAEVFADLSKSGFLSTGPVTAPIYGANFHEVVDKGHWIEIIASIFKGRDVVDSEQGRVLASRLTRTGK